MLLLQLNLATPPSEDARVPVLVLQAEGSEMVLSVDREWPVTLTAER